MAAPDVDRPAGRTALDVARTPVDAVLETYLDHALEQLAALDDALLPVAREAAALVRGGGKRLRPAFVHWGARAAGLDVDARVHQVGAAVELLHAFALVHDDVMDRAQRRRTRPAVHRAMSTWHGEQGLRGDGDWFGVGAAILAGDLLFVWADELLDQALAVDDDGDASRARSVFTRLRVEVMAGQYLDLRLAGLARPSIGEALRVALLKSGRYTVTRPLQLGAALAGSDPGASVEKALEEYGDAVGVAFQLRDDVLGLFGDPEATGKETLSDLREGKRTLLVLHALELADTSGRAVIEGALGDAALDDDAAQRVREVVRTSGALQRVEQELDERLARALGALAVLPEPARSALAELAEDAVHRQR